MEELKHVNRKQKCSACEKMYRYTIATLERQIEVLTEMLRDKHLGEKMTMVIPANAKFMEQEIVICAAIKTKDGTVIRGHRHADCVSTAMRMRYKKEDLSFADQGFVTSRNRYVSREEGRRLQDAAGIKSANPEGYMPGTLFSEDLY